MQQKTVELAMPRRRRKPIEQRTQEYKLRAGLTTEADDSGGEATAESMRDEESGGRFGKLEQADGLRWMAGPRVGSRVVCGSRSSCPGGFWVLGMGIGWDGCCPGLGLGLGWGGRPWRCVARVLPVVPG